jgi:hypothetical protein
VGDGFLERLPEVPAVSQVTEQRECMKRFFESRRVDTWVIIPVFDCPNEETVGSVDVPVAVNEKICSRGRCIERPSGVEITVSCRQQKVGCV